MSPWQKLITLEKRAIELGFEWPHFEAIIDQAMSECDEIRHSNKSQEGRVRLAEEIGDLIHACISMCVYEQISVEQTVAQTTKKFEDRLKALQKVMEKQGYSSLKGEPFDILLELWDEAKKLTKNR